MNREELERTLKEMYALSAVAGTLQACADAVLNTNGMLREVAQVLPTCAGIIQEDIAALEEMSTKLDGLVDKYSYVAVVLSNKIADAAKAPV